ncbi:MAG: hypothetical protein H2069_04770 [Legionella sp.]|nr:hypothetical protein [Legionella sp.]
MKNEFYEKRRSIQKEIDSIKEKINKLKNDCFDLIQEINQLNGRYEYKYLRLVRAFQASNEDERNGLVAKFHKKLMSIQQQTDRLENKLHNLYKKHFHYKNIIKRRKRLKDQIWLQDLAEKEPERSNQERLLTWDPNRPAALNPDLSIGSCLGALEFLPSDRLLCSFPDENDKDNDNTSASASYFIKKVKPKKTKEEPVKPKMISNSKAIQGVLQRSTGKLDLPAIRTPTIEAQTQTDPVIDLTWRTVEAKSKPEQNDSLDAKKLIGSAKTPTLSSKRKKKEPKASQSKLKSETVQINKTIASKAVNNDEKNKISTDQQSIAPPNDRVTVPLAKVEKPHSLFSFLKGLCLKRQQTQHSLPENLINDSPSLR